MGFFHVTPESSKGKQKSKLLSVTTVERLGCAACTLDKVKLQHPKMPPTGAEHPLIYFMAEAPGETEDEEGIQLIGQSGKLVRARVPSKYNKFIRWNNTLRCRPPDNRTPTNHEVACCRKLQVNDIVSSKPKAIACFGATALHWFIGDGRIQNLWRGRRLAFQLGGHAFWLYPMLHPAFILRRGGEYGGGDWVKAFDKDLKRIFQDADAGFEEPLVWTPEEARANITLLSGPAGDWPKQIRAFCQRNPSFGFDYETNTLDVEETKAKILTAGLGTHGEALAFPIGHREAGLSSWQQKVLLKVLAEELPKASKVVAHNAQFEQRWSLKWLGEGPTRATKWADSMAKAYTINETKGSHGLDEQTMIYHGIRVKSLSNLDVKHLDDEPLSEVLTYNAIDSRFCYTISFEQDKEIQREGLQNVAAMNERRSLSMALLGSVGVVANITVAKKLDAQYTKDIAVVEKGIMSRPEVKAYIAKTGKFNPHTPKDVKDLMWKVLDIHIASTEEETLSTIDHPFTKAILELRGLITLESRYLRPIATGKVIDPDGRIRSDWTHLVTATGRTASSNINLQNFPKRKHKEIRQVVGIPPNHIMTAFDYGQIEARVFGMISKDRTLCKALWADYDIHSDWAHRLAVAYPRRVGGVKKIDDKKIMKDFRTDIKNQWTFPNFFGAQLSSLSTYLQIPENVLQPLYDAFWVEFSGVKAWQERLLAQYATDLYVCAMTGRRRHGPMTPNEAINAPIQSTAAEIMLDAMERLHALAWERQEPWLNLIMNIHDDLVFYMPDSPSIYEPACELVGKTMVLSPFDFINVPVTAELRATELDWYMLEDMRVFRSTDYVVEKPKLTLKRR